MPYAIIMNTFTEHRKKSETSTQSPIMFDCDQTRGFSNYNRIEGILEAMVDDEQPLALFGRTETACDDRLRQVMCERKLRYDRRGARTMINAFAKQRGRHGRPDTLRAYPCPFCAGWHVTKTRS